MPAQSRRTVTYKGSPAGASLLAHMLRDEGLEVTQPVTTERRGGGETAVEVLLYVTGVVQDHMVDALLGAAVLKGVERFRRSPLGGRSSVEVDED